MADTFFEDKRCFVASFGAGIFERRTLFRGNVLVKFVTGTEGRSGVDRDPMDRRDAFAEIVSFLDVFLDLADDFSAVNYVILANERLFRLRFSNSQEYSDRLTRL